MKTRHADPAPGDMAEKERQRLNQIVHDLNTPLSAVSLQLFLRRKSLAKPTAQELHFLDILDRNVERIRTLIAAVTPTQQPPTPTPSTAQGSPPGRQRRRVRSTW